MPRKPINLLLSTSALLALQACSLVAANFPTPTSTPELSAAEITKLSSQAMLRVKSVHFSINLSGGLAYIDRPPTTALKKVEGDLLRPDKVKAIVRISSLGIVSEIGLVSIEGNSYVTNPVNQRWELLPPEWGWYFDPRLPFDKKYGIPAVIPQVEMEKVGVEKIGGRILYHLGGIAQGEQITGWTAGLISAGDIPVDLWIDPETFFIHRVHLVELGSKPDNPTEWDITFSMFNQPVEIQAPLVD